MAYGEADRMRLLADPGIIRNRAKVAATIANARAWFSRPDSSMEVARSDLRG